MKKYLQPRAEEGNTDTVPAMLTPGEFVIRKDAVDEIGIDKLHALNNIDRLSDMSALTNYRPAQFQEGGEVSGRKKAHLALAGMGMVPGVGNVADIADAALYGLEGDKLGALMSLASAVPLAGLAVGAGKFGKAAKKLKYDPNVASSVPTPRTKTGQFFKDPFRGVSKKKLLKEVENAGLPDAYGEPVSYFKKLDASELAEILRGYYGRDLQYVKDVGFQEGGEVKTTWSQLDNYYPTRVAGKRKRKRGDNGVIHQGIWKFPAEVVRGEAEQGGKGSRYYLSDVNQTKLESHIDMQERLSALMNMQTAPQDSIPSHLVDTYFDSELEKKSPTIKKLTNSIKELQEKAGSKLEDIEELKYRVQEKSEGYKDVVREAIDKLRFKQEGGEVMNYYGGGMVRNKRAQYQEGGVVEDERFARQNPPQPVLLKDLHSVMETLEAFGQKSKSADEITALIALKRAQSTASRGEAFGNESKPYHGPPIPEYLKPFPGLQLRKTKPVHLEPIAPVPSTGFQQGGMVPQQSLPPAGYMQEGGEVSQPMPMGEPAGIQERPSPVGERAYSEEPMDQLGLEKHEYAAYLKHGPEAYKYLAHKFKPQSQWSVYDSMVDAGSIDPYEVNKDDFVVMTRDVVNQLRAK